MLLVGNDKDFVKYSQLTPVKIRNELFFFGCDHGCGDDNFLLIKIKKSKNKTEKLGLIIKYRFPRLDSVVFILDNDSSHKIDNIEFIDFDSINSDLESIVPNSVGYIKYNRFDRDILTAKKSRIAVSHKCLNKEIDFLGPKIPFIYSQNIPDVDKLSSLSGSSLFINKLLTGILIKIVEDKLVFIHASVVKKILLNCFNNTPQLCCIPLEAKEIEYNGNNGLLVTSDSKFYEDIKSGDIVTGLNIEGIDNNCFPLDTAVALNTTIGDKVTVNILKNTGANIYNKKKIEIEVYDIDKVEIVPFNSKIFRFNKIDFTDLNTKIYFDLVLTSGNFHDSISSLIKKKYNSDKKYVVILNGDKIFPVAINRLIALPIVLKLNGNDVIDSKSFYKDLIKLKKNRLDIKIEYYQGSEIKNIKI